MTGLGVGLALEEELEDASERELDPPELDPPELLDEPPSVTLLDDPLSRDGFLLLEFPVPPSVLSSFPLRELLSVFSELSVRSVLLEPVSDCVSSDVRSPLVSEESLSRDVFLSVPLSEGAFLSLASVDASLSRDDWLPDESGFGRALLLVFLESFSDEECPDASGAVSLESFLLLPFAVSLAEEELSSGPS